MSATAGAQADESRALVDAARRQDHAAVKALLGHVRDVSAPHADGTTALHWAAHWDDLALADLLSDAGANANAANELGVTPLALACENGSGRMVERLLQRGARADAMHPGRPPVLMLCARTGSAEGVRALLDRGAAVDAREPWRQQTALMWAAARDHAAVVRLLLDRGATVDLRSGVTSRRINLADPNDVHTAVVSDVPTGGSTALLFAARQGAIASADLLVDAGANVNVVAADGAGTLAIAARSGHAGLAVRLLARGADSNAGGAGHTALHAAVLRGDRTLAEALLARGAKVDAVVRHGTMTRRAGDDFVLPESLAGATPFLLAAKFAEATLMQLFLAHGADPGAVLLDGTTALMLAAGSLSSGPLYDRRGRIALLAEPDDAATEAAVRVALGRGADVAAANKTGNTALHGAAARGYTSIVRLLLDRGAPPGARNHKGEAPADVTGREEIRTLLTRASGSVAR